MIINNNYSSAGISHKTKHIIPPKHITKISKTAESIQESKQPNTSIPIDDSIVISAEGKQQVQKSGNMFFDAEQLKEELKSSNERAEAETEAHKMRLKCQVIARRIMNGDKVPKEEHNYLVKSNPGMYMMAMSMQMQNDNPIKYKRLSEDEEPGEVSETQEIGIEQVNNTLESQGPEIAQEAETPSLE